MASPIFEVEQENISGIEPEKIRPILQLVVPKRTKLSPNQTITGNRYDLVLVCQPDDYHNYPFYDSIIELIEVIRNLRMYSPHNDVRRDHTLENSVVFATKEAIPRTRGVILHLTEVTPEIQKMFDATYLNSVPFLLFYPRDCFYKDQPLDEDAVKILKSDSHYKGEIIYCDEQEALREISLRLNDLISYK